MRDFEVWLEDLATQPVPAGASAAAVVSAMGTALMAKALWITLTRQKLGAGEVAAIEEGLDLARDQQAVLMALAQAVERAYRTVMATTGEGAPPSARRQARLAATEVPIRIAEASQALLALLPHLTALCWPAVGPDLEVGGRLLEAGREAGLLIASENIEMWASEAEVAKLQPRLTALKEEI